MEIKKVSESFEEKYHEKYDPDQIREHWLEVDKIIKDCNNSIMEMGLPDIGYTSQANQIHEYCDELINLNSYIRSAYGNVYEWLDYPLWLGFKNGVTEAISQIKAEEITTKNIMGIGGYSGTPLTKGHQWGTMPKKELTLSDFMNLMPEEAEKKEFKVRGIQGMKEFQELFQEEYEAKKKELPDLEDPRSYFEDMLVKGQEEHNDYHPFLDLLQTALDVVGFVPGIGEPADFVNAVLYGWRGDNVNAALSAAAAVPLIGNFATGGKSVVKGKKVVKVVKKIRKGSASTVDRLTSESVKQAIERNGISVENFSELLDPNKTLSKSELELVNKVRSDIGLPSSGTTMNKTIPQSDMYKYLNGEFDSVRGFVSVDEHANLLKGFNDVYEGTRLDYNNTSFKIGYGVDGISQSVGAPDTAYGKITYVLDDIDSVKICTDVPTIDNAPYTGRGFTGSKNIVLPEQIQTPRTFVDGDILGIYDSTTGKLAQQFIYDSDFGWILK